MTFFNRFNDFARFLNRAGILTLLVFALSLLVVSATGRAQDAQSPKTFIEQLGLTEDSSHMMNDKLLAEVDAAGEEWVANYEKIKTPEDLKAYQDTRLKAFREALGPMWERTPLNVQVTGSGTKEKYRYENIVFESLPGVYVTALLTLPLEERYPGPYPAMLIVCGHSLEGKGYDLYQSLGILAAVNGVAALVMDPIDQGERFQFTKDDGSFRLASVAAHNMVQAGSILVGRSAATFEVWDGMRGIDYLQSRDDIVKDQIGVCGTSGGGT